MARKWPHLDFSADWVSHHHQNWRMWFGELQAPRVLEIGSYEGRSCVWWLEHLSAELVTCIDSWEGSQYPEPRQGDMIGRFLHNIDGDPRVEVLRGLSHVMLESIQDRTESYDLVYVDGAHDDTNAYRDAALSWPLLRRGGFMLFDDYLGVFRLKDGSTIAAGPAIDRFVAEHAHDCERLPERDHGQLCVRKK